MPDPRYMIVPADARPQKNLTLEEAAERTGMHRDMILEFVRARVVHVVHPAPEEPPHFDEFGIARLRHIEHLRRDEKMSLRTVCYIIRLLDRVDAAERELRALRERMR